MFGTVAYLLDSKVIYPCRDFSFLESLFNKVIQMSVEQRNGVFP